MLPGKNIDNRYHVLNPELLPERWEVDARRGEGRDLIPVIDGAPVTGAIAANPDRVLALYFDHTVSSRPGGFLEIDPAPVPEKVPDGEKRFLAVAWVIMGDVQLKPSGTISRVALRSVSASAGPRGG